jgi:hypothetical protein
MNKNIQTIIELTGCSEDDAMRVYAETNDVEDAVDKLLPAAKNHARKYYDAIRPVRTYTQEEQELKKLRDAMKKMDDQRLTTLNPRGFVVPSAPNIHHEEMALQSNCDQECQLPVLQLEAQTQGTVCPLPSECSSDSP